MQSIIVPSSVPLDHVLKRNTRTTDNDEASTSEVRTRTRLDSTIGMEFGEDDDDEPREDEYPGDKTPAS